MATRTRNPAWTIIAATITAAALIFTADGAELRSAVSETGKTRDLVNRPDCWTDDAATSGWDRGLFR
jgi:hypothetical protein